MADPEELINKECTDCGRDFLIARKVRRCPDCGHPLVRDHVVEELKREERERQERIKRLYEF